MISSGVNLYLLVALVTGASLHWASAKSSFRSKSKRGILGATSGGLSFGMFSEWTSTLSIIEASLAGDLAFYGYVFVGGFYTMCIVWGWNLYTTRRFLVQ
jgi:hypothetical protein